MKTISLVAVVLCLAAWPTAQGTAQDQTGPVYEPGSGVSAPRVLKEAKPAYPSDAVKAGIQGTVTLECVVQPDGTVGAVRVKKTLDPGLDKEAIKAVKLWRFEPGRKDGAAVPVRVSLEMTFALRK
jgi:protein TonB